MEPKQPLKAYDGTTTVDVSLLRVGPGAIEADNSVDLADLTALGITATASEINRFNDVSEDIEGLTTSGALSVSKVYSRLSLSGSGAVTLAAPDGTFTGHLKTILMKPDIAGDVTLALTNIVGQSSGTTATFSDDGDTLVLLALDTNWLVIREYGIALS